LTPPLAALLFTRVVMMVIPARLMPVMEAGDAFMLPWFVMTVIRARMMYASTVNASLHLSIAMMVTPVQLIYVMQGYAFIHQSPVAALPV